ncbi:hypothetical protein [Natronorubrum sp. FCH18a]|uniref:hypothetical protein n=1 Tax=Natronorubrum sp. FCH18a TaxID=3447018 RepID=UPI003F518086
MAGPSSVPSLPSGVPSREWWYRSHKDGRSPVGIYLLAFFFGANAGTGFFLLIDALPSVYAEFSAWRLGRVGLLSGTFLLFLETFRGVLNHQPIGFAGGITICLFLVGFGAYWLLSGETEPGRVAVILAGIVAGYLLHRRDLFFPPEADCEPSDAEETSRDD